MRRLNNRMLAAVPAVIARLESIPPEIECVLSVLVVACAVTVAWILTL
jgi:hypothetical protein